MDPHAGVSLHVTQASVLTSTEPPGVHKRAQIGNPLYQQNTCKYLYICILSFYVTNASYERKEKSKTAEIKDNRIVPIKEKEVDALTLKNKLGTRYNEKRLATKAKYQPGRWVSTKRWENRKSWNVRVKLRKRR